MKKTINCKIIVVDDEPDIIKSIQVGLTKINTNYYVIGVNNGRALFNLLQQGQIPDIIILDIMLPEMNGWQILDILRTNKPWKDIPVVFITALDDRETMEKGIKSNTFCLKKPFRIEELRDTIEKVMGRNFLF